MLIVNATVMKPEAMNIGQEAPPPTNSSGQKMARSME